MKPLPTRDALRLMLAVNLNGTLMMLGKDLSATRSETRRQCLLALLQEAGMPLWAVLAVGSVHQPAVLRRLGMEGWRWTLGGLQEWTRFALCEGGGLAFIGPPRGPRVGLAYGIDLISDNCPWGQRGLLGREPPLIHAKGFDWIWEGRGPGY